ncbi:MAG TPA: DUF308 domain-containing protein [Gaiellaceae bacterium]|nr:DUF308 domain-containing protein [Gaiellaceae bacterium]
MSDVAAPLSESERSTILDAASVWWLYLITGTAWLLFSIIVFRFDYTTVSAIAILFGILMLSFAAVELVSVAMTDGWRRLLHVVLAVAFVVIGIVSFIHPGDTFKALAAVISFYFIIKGTLDLIVAFATRPENDLWWLGLIAGIVQIILGFWAAGDFGNKVILLVVWVGVAALIRGISEIIYAFTLRSMKGAV